MGALVKKLFRVASVLIFVAVLSIVAAAQARNDSEVIVAAEKAWADAPVRHDYETFAKYMSEDYVLIEVNTESGKKPSFEFSTKAQWVERVSSGREKYDSVEIHDLKVLLNGDVATVSGQYSQKGTQDGKDISASGLYVDTWVKRQGKWLLINSVFP
jgi:ketosteroid isomerase-like protein